MDLQPTGRETEVVEVGQPTMCANGHPLWPRNVLVGYGDRPSGGRARNYTCKTCWAVWWDEGR